MNDETSLADTIPKSTVGERAFAVLGSIALVTGLCAGVSYLTAPHHAGEAPVNHLALIGEAVASAINHADPSTVLGAEVVLFCLIVIYCIRTVIGINRDVDSIVEHVAHAFKPCRSCAEPIRQQADVCRHCGCQQTHA